MIRGVGVTVVAGVLATGAYVVGGGGGPDPGTANFWIDTSGGSCVDNAAPVAYANDGTECDSLDEAYDLAECGDTVLIKGGDYVSDGEQTVTGDRSCGSGTYTVGASKGVTMTGGVLIELASGETAVFDDSNFEADWLEVSKGDGASLTFGEGPVRGDNSIDANGSNTTLQNLILRGVSLGDMYLNNEASSGANQMDNIAIVDSDIGPWDGSVPLIGEPFYAQGCTCGGSGVTIGTDIVLDGVSWHDIEIPDEPDPHIEALRIDGGYNGFTVRNSNFYDNVATSTATVLLTNAGGAADSRNITFVNNYFGADQGDSFFVMTLGGPTCVNLTIKYNTFLRSWHDIPCSATNGVISGNLGVKASSTCTSGFTYTKNVWQHSSNVACGTDTWVNGTAGSTSALGLGGSLGFDVQPGSAALGAGELTHCPALDHDGNGRPTGGGNCDAGADEG